MYGYHILNLSYFIYFLPFWSQLTNQTSPELLTIFTFFIQSHSTLSNLSLVLCMCEVFLITASDMTWSIYHCRPPNPPPLHVMVFIPLLSKKRTDQCKFIQNKTKMLHGLSEQLAFSNTSVCDVLSRWQPTGNDICRTRWIQPPVKYNKTTAHRPICFDDEAMTLTLTSLSLYQQQSQI